jgi:hypothetical protein
MTAMLYLLEANCCMPHTAKQQLFAAVIHVFCAATSIIDDVLALVTANTAHALLIITQYHVVQMLCAAVIVLYTNCTNLKFEK